jgi:hypothetical protein
MVEKTILPTLDIGTTRRLRDALKTGPSIPSDILAAIGQNLGISEFPNLKVFRTWNELVVDAVAMLDGMREEAYVASRFFEPKITQAGLRAAGRGCKLHALHTARFNLSTGQQISEAMRNDPEVTRIFERLLVNPNIDIKEAGFYFSFLVIDGLVVGIEIISPEDPASFFLGLQFESAEFASRLILYFRDLEQTAVEDKRKKILREGR